MSCFLCFIYFCEEVLKKEEIYGNTKYGQCTYR